MTSSSSSSYEAVSDKASPSSSKVVHKPAVAAGAEGLICCCCCVSLSSCQAAMMCATCQDVVLCVSCWSRGAEVGSHKPGDDYMLLPSSPVPGFSVFPHTYPHWSVEEDEQLLENIEHFGFGNWEDSVSGVAGKSGDDAEKHYRDAFLNSSLGVVTLRDVGRPVIKDFTAVSDDGPLSPTLYTPRQPVIDLTQDETHTLGYLPHRDDFEIDFDNDAEKCCCDVKQSLEDGKVDTEYKLSLIDMYARRRRERERRKAIVKNNNLILDFMRPEKSGVLGRSRKKQTKDVKDIQDRLRVYAQFQTASQREEFVENMLAEKRCRERISELMNYRKHGITKREDCSEFDDEKYLRDKRKMKKRPGTMSSSSPSSASSAIRRALHTSQSGKKEERAGDLSEDTGKVEQEQGREKAAEKGEALVTDTSDLLSNREKRLCKNLGVTPAYYITLKTVVIADSLNHSEEDGSESSNGASEEGVKVDKVKEEIKDYLHTNNWIH